MAGHEVKFRVALTVEQAAEFLEKIAKVLRKGKGTIKVKDRTLVLRPAPTVLLKGEAGVAIGQGWLELELDWREAGTISIEPQEADNEEGADDNWSAVEDWEDEEWEDEEGYVNDEEETDEKRSKAGEVRNEDGTTPG